MMKGKQTSHGMRTKDVVLSRDLHQLKNSRGSKKFEKNKARNLSTQKQRENTYNVSHDEDQFNIKVQNGQIFESEFNAEQSEDEVHEEIPQEFRKSSDIELDKEAVKNFEKHNQYLLTQLNKDIDGFIMINQKKSVKQFQKNKKRIQSHNEMYETKGSFFQSGGSCNREPSIDHNDANISYTTGEIVVLLYRL